VSTLGENDADLHYHDGSHRWGPEQDVGRRAVMRAHIAEHQRRYGHEPVRRSRRDIAGPYLREKT
jgi:hypothetical protein